jgi:hypothetical protein
MRSRGPREFRQNGSEVSATAFAEIHLTTPGIVGSQTFLPNLFMKTSWAPRATNTRRSAAGLRVPDVRV